MYRSIASNEGNFINTRYGIVIHRDFIPLYSDDNYAKFLGYSSAKEVVELPSLFDVLCPSEHQEASYNYQEIMAGRKPPRIQTCKNIDRDGNEITVLTIDHIVDWEGEKALQVTIIDISSYLEIQQKLKENEERYRNLIDDSVQGMVVHQNLKLVFCNPAFAEMFGFNDTETLIGHKDILSLLSPEYHATVISQTGSLMSGKQQRMKDEVKGIRADGSSVWLNVLSNTIEWNGEAAIQMTAIDISEQHRLQEQLEKRANYDGLTNLLNRRSMTEIIEVQFKKIKLGVPPLCCVLIDLDNFKQVNDQYGHDAGDELLKHFAALSKKLLRSNDYIGRWGGEEFLLLLPETSINDARRISERLRVEISKLTLMHEGLELMCTVSMGISASSAGTKNARMLITNADKALYEAKALGKNHVRLYS